MFSFTISILFGCSVFRYCFVPIPRAIYCHTPSPLPKRVRRHFQQRLRRAFAPRGESQLKLRGLPLQGSPRTLSYSYLSHLLTNSRHEALGGCYHRLCIPYREYPGIQPRGAREGRVVLTVSSHYLFYKTDSPLIRQMSEKELAQRIVPRASRLLRRSCIGFKARARWDTLQRHESPSLCEAL